MAKRKKVTQAQIFGRQGVALVEERLLEMGFTWHPTGQDLEAGIDGFAELRDSATGEVSGCFLHIQSRARSTLEKDTSDSFEYTCTQDELDYWLGGTAPVLLVVSQPRDKRAWWVSIKDYFRTPENKKSRRIRFNKRSDLFDATAAERLRSLGAAAGSGAYFRPPPRVETLISNLLPVTRLPPKLYSATTTFRVTATKSARSSVNMSIGRRTNTFCTGRASCRFTIFARSPGPTSVIHRQLCLSKRGTGAIRRTWRHVGTLPGS